MGRSLNKAERDESRRSAAQKGGARKQRRDNSDAEAEVFDILDAATTTGNMTEPQRSKLWQPGQEERHLKQLEQEAAQLPVQPPIYKDMAAIGSLTSYGKGLIAQVTEPPPQNAVVSRKNGLTQDAQGKRDARYRHMPDPSISVLPPEMLEIIRDRPLRGEIKFFDSTPTKLFGFIIVDPLDVTPEQLATMTQKQRSALLRKEVFFHYNDVSQPIVKGADAFPTLVERRHYNNFNPPYPKAGDRVVFFPILVPPPGRGGKGATKADAQMRPKAVPWAYEAEWNHAMDVALGDLKLE